MALVNYHNHTHLCGHATGTLDDYIECAIEQGIAEFGFSDHAPLPLFLRKGITMHPFQCESYIAEVEKRKEKYKNKIAIKLGFEVDYPFFKSFDKKYLEDERIDFFIGSCHFIEEWPFDHSDYIDEFDKRDLEKVYEQYYAIMLNLAESKHFNIIGHLDLIKKFGHRAQSNFKELLVKIAAASRDNDMAFELNTSGLIKPVKEIYPQDYIIELFFNENVAVTLGSDSHSPEEVGQGFALAVEKLKKAGYRAISGFDKKKRYDIPL